MSATKAAVSKPSLQPVWAGEEACSDVDGASYLNTILNESMAQSLITRGFCVIPLPSHVQSTYAKFADSLAAFCHQPVAIKGKFAKVTNNTLMEDATFTPNQYHGYSAMSGLKEQFMVRSCGRGVDLSMPGSYEGSPHFGSHALQLYEQLDQLCRRALEATCDELKMSRSVIDRVLDPVNHVSTPSHDGVKVINASDGDRCHTSYMIPGYTSSSILDVFHYLNEFKVDTGDFDKFHNNHASHSDSGILTLVPVTDEPGLEVLDQKLKQWIALEKIIHEQKPNGAHRQYATIFWGDSHEYFRDVSSSQPLSACMHRVAKCSRERYSIVFKQRTVPTTTAPRYQEDYVIAAGQRRALRQQLIKRATIAATASLIVAGVALSFMSRSSSSTKTKSVPLIQ